MGLFDKKTCDFCGGKIGLLGDKKYAEGDMCKDCASKLSPWFNNRKESTKAQLEAQLAYREENKQQVAAFQTTRSLGNYTKLLIDDHNRKFMVTSSSDIIKANPDVLSFDQATGCSLDVDERRSEMMRKDPSGKSVSYNPPRYEYSYNFLVSIFVNNPYFKEISYSLSNGYVETGEQRMNTVASSWNMHRSAIGLRSGVDKCNDYFALGNEIKQAVEQMSMQGQYPNQDVRAPQGYQAPAQQAPQWQTTAAAAAAPAAAAQARTTCPFCEAPLSPGDRFCKYCGSKLD